jgi:hypothetical protein
MASDEDAGAGTAGTISSDETAADEASDEAGTAELDVAAAAEEEDAAAAELDDSAAAAEDSDACRSDAAEDAAAASELACAAAEDDAAASSEDAEAAALLALEAAGGGGVLLPQALSIRTAAKVSGSPAIGLICMSGFLFGRNVRSPSPQRGPSSGGLYYPELRFCRGRPAGNSRHFGDVAAWNIHPLCPRKQQRY